MSLRAIVASSVRVVVALHQQHWNFQPKIGLRKKRKKKKVERRRWKVLIQKELKEEYQKSQV